MSDCVWVIWVRTINIRTFSLIIWCSSSVSGIIRRNFFENTAAMTGVSWFCFSECDDVYFLQDESICPSSWLKMIPLPLSRLLYRELHTRCDCVYLKGNLYLPIRFCVLQTMARTMLTICYYVGKEVSTITSLRIHRNTKGAKIRNSMNTTERIL